MQLARNCKYLTKVDVHNADPLDVMGIKVLQHELTNQVRMTDQERIMDIAAHCREAVNVNLTQEAVKELLQTKYEDLKNVIFKEVADVGVREVMKYCNDLLQVTLLSSTVTDEGVKELARNCKDLTTVHLAGTKVSNAGIQALAKNCKGLTKVNVQRTKVTHAGSKNLPQDCITLQDGDDQQTSCCGPSPRPSKT